MTIQTFRNTVKTIVKKKENFKPKPMKKMTRFYSPVATVFFLLLWLGALGASVEPVFYPGNPACADLTSCSCQYGFKINQAPNGTFPIINGEGTTLTGGAMPDPSNTITILNSDESYFDWTSTLPIKAVIVKGGPNANVYFYDPPSYGDTGLHAPINPENGMPFGLSHLEFCFQYELRINKTAVPAFTREYTWEIDKTADGAYNLFTGDGVEHLFTVSVDQTLTDKDWAVGGSIEIYNPAPTAATILSVSDVISGYGAVAVTCPVTFPYDLASGGTLTCTYASTLPDGTSRTNTATVTTEGAVGGGAAQAAIAFGEPTTIAGYPTINVTDTNGESWSASTDASWSYSKDYYCGSDAGENVNTATIAETGQLASATVILNCYDLTVAKDASTSFDRLYTWDIDKVHDAGEICLVLAEGQLYQVNYNVTVSSMFTDLNWKVSGQITISNPAPMNAPLTGVTDLVSPDILASVSCPALTVPAGGSMTCTYSADLPDGTNRTNTATATLQNYFYALQGDPTTNGTTSFSGNASVDFSTATINHIDECVNVSDTNIGNLGNVCYGEAPRTFAYARNIGIAQGGSYVCGENNYVDNTASFVTHDTGTTGSDDATVCFVIPCGGCTLTPGYWKTHSSYGPAPYDETWAMIGEDTPFFASGKSWYQALWTAPAGNVYYILAPAYIATHLNLLNGAYAPAEVTGALAQAAVYLALPPTTKWSKTQKTEMTNLALLLDYYNNGLIGPGHCSDDFEIMPMGAVLPVAPVEDEEWMAAEFSLESYPNPFNTSVTFNFTLPEESQVELLIFNLSGQLVARVADGHYAAGNHNLTWTAPDNLINGIYIYRLQTPENVSIQKMLFSK